MAVLSRRVIRYQPSRSDDGALRQRWRELATERRRLGYCGLGYLLAGEGITTYLKKLLRIYHEEGLWVRRRGARKRALGTRRPMVLPDGPNKRWSLHFLSDSLTCGQRLRIRCVVYDYTRHCPALVADTSLSGARLARDLKSQMSDRGKPMQNAFAKSFIGLLWDECLSETLLTSRSHGRFALAAWRDDCNTVRRHSKLGAGRPRPDRQQTCLGACPQTHCHPNQTVIVTAPDSGSDW
jgi:putative transposase